MQLANKPEQLFFPVLQLIFDTFRLWSLQQNTAFQFMQIFHEGRRWEQILMTWQKGKSF